MRNRKREENPHPFVGFRYLDKGLYVAEFIA